MCLFNREKLHLHRSIERLQQDLTEFQAIYHDLRREIYELKMEEEARNQQRHLQHGQQINHAGFGHSDPDLDFMMEVGIHRGGKPVRNSARNEAFIGMPLESGVKRRLPSQPQPNDWIARPAFETTPDLYSSGKLDHIHQQPLVINTSAVMCESSSNGISKVKPARSPIYANAHVAVKTKPVIPTDGILQIVEAGKNVGEPTEPRVPSSLFQQKQGDQDYENLNELLNELAACGTQAQQALITSDTKELAKDLETQNIGETNPQASPKSAEIVVASTTESSTEETPTQNNDDLKTTTTSETPDIAQTSQTELHNDPDSSQEKSAKEETSEINSDQNMSPKSTQPPQEESPTINDPTTDDPALPVESVVDIKAETSPTSEQCESSTVKTLIKLNESEPISKNNSDSNPTSSESPEDVKSNGDSVKNEGLANFNAMSPTAENIAQEQTQEVNNGDNTDATTDKVPSLTEQPSGDLKQEEVVPEIMAEDEKSLEEEEESLQNDKDYTTSV